jgi:hypothetical protein
MKRTLLFFIFLMMVTGASAYTQIIDSSTDWNQPPPSYRVDIDISDGKIVVSENQTTQAGEFLWLANADIGTITKIDTNTNTIVGKFRTCSSGTSCSPSRTAVDSEGYVWVGNRVAPMGLIKIAPHISKCIDRNQDGNITTSNDTTILAWGADECVIGYAATPNDIRPIAVDLNGHIWFGSYEGNWIREIPDPQNFNNLSVNYLQYTSYPIGGYGAAVDNQGNIWLSQVGTSATTIGYIDSINKDYHTLNHGCASYGLNTYANYGLKGCSSAGGFYVYTANPTTGAIEYVDAVTGGGYTRSLAYHSTRNEIWYANFNDGWLYKYPITNGDPWAIASATPVLDVGSETIGTVIDSDGYVWVTEYSPGIANKIDPATGTEVAQVTGISAPYTYSDATGSNLFQYITTGQWGTFYQGSSNEYMQVDWVEGNNPEDNIKAYYHMQGFSHPVSVFNGLPFSVDTDGRSSDNIELWFEITTNGDLSSPYVDSMTVKISDWRCMAWGPCVNLIQTCLTLEDKSGTNISEQPVPSDFTRTCNPGGGALPGDNTTNPNQPGTPLLGPVPPIPTTCGDNWCKYPEETMENCPSDCFKGGEECGDLECKSPYENKGQCPYDCGLPECGDYVCSFPVETINTCRGDCLFPGQECGDRSCGLGETENNCPYDCVMPPVEEPIIEQPIFELPIFELPKLPFNFENLEVVNVIRDLFALLRNRVSETLSRPTSVVILAGLIGISIYLATTIKPMKKGRTKR